MAEQSVLAAVDLGSNSFRLQLGRVVGDQIYPLDSLREPVRLGAGLTESKRLDEPSQERALACLKRFGERLRGLPREAVRAVGTNTLRVAKNGPDFLRRAQNALGFPIEVIAGKEEARLIYLGVAHELPPSGENRLVIDIGGGSTEFIIGRKLRAQRLESLYMGCVSFSLRYFGDGKLGKGAMKEAEVAAGTELETIAGDFHRGHWDSAYGASGTVRSIGDILEQSGWSAGGITRDGLDRLRSHLIKAGDLKKLHLPGLRSDRVPVLPGGLAILNAAFAHLGIEAMTPASGALREGVLYDLLGRFHHADQREATVRQFMERYHVDTAQAARVADLAVAIGRQLLAGDPEIDARLQLLRWAAMLHEVGLSVAHSGYHKHSAYILRYADMPGFSRMEQVRLSNLAFAHRGALKKIAGVITDPQELAEIAALRLAALMNHGRRSLRLPRLGAARVKNGFELRLPPDWLEEHPLTEHALKAEVREWRHLGPDLTVTPETPAGLAASV